MVKCTPRILFGFFFDPVISHVPLQKKILNNFKRLTAKNVLLLVNALMCRSEVVFKFGDMSYFNQHPWMQLKLNMILYT